MEEATTIMCGLDLKNSNCYKNFRKCKTSQVVKDYSVTTSLIK